MRTVMPNFMTEYFNRNHTGGRARRRSISAGAVLAALFFPLLAAVSCIKADDSLGVGLIPEDERLSLRRDSSFRIETYNVTVDSIIASGMQTNYVGSRVDPVTGAVRGGLVFQMSAASFGNDSLFGTTPTIDSLFIRFGISDTYGKTSVEQTFDVYVLTERVYWDSVYYTDFDPTPIVGETPLFSFQHSGDADYVVKRIENADFISRLADTTGYTVDSLFKKRFKGFYLKAQGDADAALYAVDMTDSYFIAHYHNKDAKPDTTYAMYRIMPNLPSSYYYTYNQCINVLDYDFAGVDPELHLDDPEHPAVTAYVQGYGGIQTRLHFTKESVDALKAKATAAGYSEIAVNKAVLQFPFPTRDPEAMDDMYGRLGMYLDFKTFDPIPDYSYYMENNGYYISYGGYINRSRYMYEMDITYYVQRLLREDYEKRDVMLAPSASEAELHKFDESVLSGSESAEPPLLIITYTMIK